MKKQRILIESIRYITGHQKSIKVKGKPTDMVVYKDVLKASKRLYEALQMENVRLSYIEDLVQKKNRAAKRFRKVTGHAWPL